MHGRSACVRGRACPCSFPPCLLLRACATEPMRLRARMHAALPQRIRIVGSPLIIHVSHAPARFPLSPHLQSQRSFVEVAEGRWPSGAKALVSIRVRTRSKRGAAPRRALVSLEVVPARGVVPPLPRGGAAHAAGPGRGHAAGRCDACRSADGGGRCRRAGAKGRLAGGLWTDAAHGPRPAARAARRAAPVAVRHALTRGLRWARTSSEVQRDSASGTPSGRWGFRANPARSTGQQDSRRPSPQGRPLPATHGPSGSPSRADHTPGL